ncbi:MAG: hypothetical protein E3K32_03140 [wastewater metagenome]|nr:hypothetical protein [Candidatus Loosdrechtia aerotolerans]
MIAIAILFGLALQESKANTEIDLQKDVYLFLHGRRDLQENAENALVTRGFLKEKIIVATPNKVGNVGDYMAMLWKPPDPDQIKIQQITGVKEVEPEGMAGLWKGVSRKDIDTIRLE